MTPTTLPPTLHARPMHAGDAAAWADLLAAAEEAARTGEHYDVEDLVEELADPGVDHARDSLLVLEGELPVAYQILHRRRPDDRLWLVSEGTVRPSHRRRGVGAALIADGLRRAAEEDARYSMRVMGLDTGATAAAERAGLVPVRWWSQMSRPMTASTTGSTTGPTTGLVAAPLPDGLVLHTLGPDYDAARWDEPLRAAHNAAFADHWGSSPVSAQAWAPTRTGSRSFRPAASVAVCTPGGDVVGYVLSQEHVAETARTGRRDLWVLDVGTLRAWRGRGVASAALAHVLATARDLGYDTASLFVDTGNPTGALGVYTRQGFRPVRRDVSYATP
ncbi:MAG TPA: GNAT family N-acetyltransferase [Pseudonocardia sp.]|nr:GNAT family N-acetyltransferase [Pseudonocardia sp.]